MVEISLWRCEEEDNRGKQLEDIILKNDFNDII